MVHWGSVTGPRGRYTGEQVPTGLRLRGDCRLLGQRGDCITACSSLCYTTHGHTIISTTSILAALYRY